MTLAMTPVNQYSQTGHITFIHCPWYFCDGRKQHTVAQHFKSNIFTNLHSTIKATLNSEQRFIKLYTILVRQ